MSKSNIEILLDMLGKTEFEREVPTFVPPDALVLCTFIFRCRCGKEHRGPNSKLLLRNKRNYTSVKNWMDAYNSIPRETIFRVQEVPACSECFQTANWVQEDFRLKASVEQNDGKSGGDA